MEKARQKRSVVARRRGPSTAVLVGVIVVVLFAAVVGFGVYRANRSSPDSLAIPPGATEAGVPVDQAEPAATIDIYLDFQCPACRAYEQQSGATLEEMITNGQAQVIYHPVAYLDRYSSTDYSTRSSQASGCAAEARVFPAYLQLLFAHQPPENSAGLTDERLIELGHQAGAGSDFATCVSQARYASWTAHLTDAASAAGIDGTPTVLVDGQRIANTDEALRHAVAVAQG
jgi:protein-disulfide isomerase